MNHFFEALIKKQEPYPVNALDQLWQQPRRNEEPSKGEELFEPIPE